MARACEAASRPSSTREGVSRRSEAEATDEAGEVRGAVLCGAGLKRAAARAAQATEAPQGASETSDRGAQRACAALAAGALEVLAVNSPVPIYKQTAARQSVTYK